MTQPKWSELYRTDDRTVLVDQTGVYAPEMIVEETCDDMEIRTTYRFPLDRCWQATRDDGSTFLVSMDPARQDLPYAYYVPWFRDSLGSIAESCGIEIGKLIDSLCSDDPHKLASAYEAIGGYHGFLNFDQYPVNS